jgi:hypothetical protein
VLEMREIADSGVLQLLAIPVLVVLFLLPTLIGLVRGVDQLALVFLVNLIGAPALIGWPAALFLAFGPRRQPPRTPRAVPRRQPGYWPEQPGRHWR